METTTKQTIEKKWTEKAQEVLLNKKIVKVRYLTETEMEGLGWYKNPVCFQLSDGTLCFLSADDEGNDGGSLFYQTDNGIDCLPVL